MPNSIGHLRFSLKKQKNHFCPQIPAINPSELQLHLENTEQAHLLALTRSCLVPEGKEG